MPNKILSCHEHAHRIFFPLTMAAYMKSHKNKENLPRSENLKQLCNSNKTFVHHGNTNMLDFKKLFFFSKEQGYLPLEQKNVTFPKKIAPAKLTKLFVFLNMEILPWKKNGEMENLMARQNLSDS